MFLFLFVLKKKTIRFKKKLTFGKKKKLSHRTKSPFSCQWTGCYVGTTNAFIWVKFGKSPSKRSEWIKYLKWPGWGTHDLLWVTTQGSILMSRRIIIPRTCFSGSVTRKRLLWVACLWGMKKTRHIEKRHSCVQSLSIWKVVGNGIGKQLLRPFHQ